jgi:hypothetical protein
VLALAAVAHRASGRSALEWPYGIPGTIERVVAAQGWIADGERWPVPQGMTPAVSFIAPGCDGKLRVVYMSIGMQEAPMQENLAGPDYKFHYIYLGRRSTKLEPTTFQLTWLRERTLSFFGLSKFAAISVVLFVAEPLECRVAETIDWLPVWQSQRVKAGASASN